MTAAQPPLRQLLTMGREEELAKCGHTHPRRKKSRAGVQGREQRGPRDCIGSPRGPGPIGPGPRGLRRTTLLGRTVDKAVPVVGSGAVMVRS